MPGAGTRPATTIAEPPARCLDVTRLVSRVGRGPHTGIDRVEQAYLDHLLSLPAPLFLLCRTATGYVLLDRQGALALASRLAGAVAWGGPDLAGFLSRKLSAPRRRAEADLRRLSVARARRGRLARLLRTHLPEGTAYLNVGHSNLHPEVFEAWRALPGARVGVLVHDTIPLDYPGFQRPGTPARFEAMLRRVGASADLAIYNSEATRTASETWFARWGRVPPGVVAHLGVVPAPPDQAALPPGLSLPRPYFLALGTIEPRKNHALLLDVWQALSAELPPEDLPGLVIVGSRGWKNEEVFRRLDALSPKAGIVELSNLSDGAVTALIDGAAALLFPSRAEGYGLPPMEAAARGTPTICANLPVYREILGDYPVYADPDDVYFWKQSIRNLAESMQAGQSGEGTRRVPPDLPDWSSHFGVVLART